MEREGLEGARLHDRDLERALLDPGRGIPGRGRRPRRRATGPARGRRPRPRQQRCGAGCRRARREPAQALAGPGLAPQPGARGLRGPRGLRLQEPRPRDAPACSRAGLAELRGHVEGAGRPLQLHLARPCSSRAGSRGRSGPGPGCPRRPPRRSWRRGRAGSAGWRAAAAGPRPPPPALERDALADALQVAHRRAHLGLHVQLALVERALPGGEVELGHGAVRLVGRALERVGGGDPEGGAGVRAVPGVADRTGRRRGG